MIVETRKKVAFVTLYMGRKPTPPFVRSLEACIPAVEAAGWEHSVAVEENCPYISAARAKVIRKAANADVDFIVFLDWDLEWQPEDMVKLLETEGDVVAGTYRKPNVEEIYMGVLATDKTGQLMVRSDGCIKAEKIPAGFLKVSMNAVNAFARRYPELLFGPPLSQQIDMFNHGVIEGVWYGEDYAFSKRWIEMGGEIWIIPDLNLNHWKNNATEVYKGNFHQHLINYNKEKQDEEN
jgi:hypothetical protein